MREGERVEDVAIQRACSRHGQSRTSEPRRKSNTVFETVLESLCKRQAQLPVREFKAKIYLDSRFGYLSLFARLFYSKSTDAPPISAKRESPLDLY